MMVRNAPILEESVPNQVVVLTLETFLQAVSMLYMVPGIILRPP